MLLPEHLQRLEREVDECAGPTSFGLPWLPGMNARRAHRQFGRMVPTGRVSVRTIQGEILKTGLGPQGIREFCCEAMSERVESIFWDFGQVEGG
jgi:hypothetical protein